MLDMKNLIYLKDILILQAQSVDLRIKCTDKSFGTWEASDVEVLIPLKRKYGKE
jgi:hypothetical protein